MRTRLFVRVVCYGLKIVPRREDFRVIIFLFSDFRAVISPFSFLILLAHPRKSWRPSKINCWSYTVRLRQTLTLLPPATKVPPHTSQHTPHAHFKYHNVASWLFNFRSLWTSCTDCWPHSWRSSWSRCVVADSCFIHCTLFFISLEHLQTAL